MQQAGHSSVWLLLLRAAKAGYDFTCKSLKLMDMPSLKHLNIVSNKQRQRLFRSLSYNLDFGA